MSKSYGPASSRENIQLFNFLQTASSTASRSHFFILHQLNIHTY